MFRNIHFQVIRKVFSNILFLLTASFLVCAVLAYLFDEALKAFILSGFITLILAVALRPYSDNKVAETNIDRRDAYLTVTLSWILLGLVGTLPYIISGSIPGFINAFFESASGFSTTGYSILIYI